MYKILFSLLICSLLTISCKKVQTVENPNLPQTNGRDIFADNAYVIDTSAILNVNLNTVEITKAKTTLRPKIGDIIVAAPTLSNPYGVLRRVTSVQETSTTATMSTELASLDEAFKKITVDTIVYTPMETTTTYSTDAIFGFAFNNNTSMFNGLKVDGILKVNMPDVHFKITKGVGLSLNVIFEAKLNTKGSTIGITNSSENEIKLATERPLKTISLSPFYVLIGGIPFIFFHEVKFSILPVTVTGKASWNITPVVEATAGIKYENGWKNLSSISLTGTSKPLKQSDFSPNIALNAELTVIKAEYALAPLNEKLLKLSFEVPTKLTFTAQPFQSPNYSLSLSTSLGIKAETRFFFKSGAEVTYNIAEFSKKILEGDWIEPASVSIVSGNNQTDNPNATLSKPLVVEVKDIDGKPMQGIGVKWAIGSGGGQLTPDSSVTNAAGQASTSWKLGGSGPQSVSAIVKKSNGSNVTGSPLTFIAVTKEPASIVIVSGNNQNGFANTNLSSPLLVEVKDATGTVMNGVTVSWSVNAGGGQVTTVNTTTDASGRTSNTWKLGLTGTQTVTASVKKNDGSSLNSTFSGVINPASISSVSISDWTKIGSICSTFHQSGDGKITVNFNSTAPLVGLINITHYWDNDADGKFEGNNGGNSTDISTLQRSGNQVTLRNEFCWGSKTTIVKIEVKYLLGGTVSNIFSTIVSKP